jgi:hypothetical protein
MLNEKMESTRPGRRPLRPGARERKALREKVMENIQPGTMQETATAMTKYLINNLVDLSRTLKKYPYVEYATCIGVHIDPKTFFATVTDYEIFDDGARGAQFYSIDGHVRRIYFETGWKDQKGKTIEEIIDGFSGGEPISELDIPELMEIPDRIWDIDFVVDASKDEISIYPFHFINAFGTDRYDENIRFGAVVYEGIRFIAKGDYNWKDNEGKEMSCESKPRGFTAKNE